MRPRPFAMLDIVVVLLVGWGCSKPLQNERAEDQTRINTHVVHDSPVHPDDEQMILGYWRVVEATADGKRYSRAVATIYVFEKTGKVRIVGHDYEAINEFRIDSRARPKRLVSYFFDPKIAGAGIYELTMDELRWRTADDEQDLTFTEQPKGRWNEERMVRIAPDEGQALIRNLQGNPKPRRSGNR